MTKYGSGDVVAVLVNGRDIDAYLTSVRWKKGIVSQDVTTLGNAWRKHGDTKLRESELSYEGFYDDDNLNAETYFGLAPVVTLMLDANTLGKYFEGFRGPVEESYERMIDIGALHKIGVTFKGSQEVESGLIVKTLAAVTTDGNSDATDIDGTAASALGCVGYLQCVTITLDTATNLAVTLRDSADAITYGAITGGAFTVRTTAGAQRLAVAAAAATPKRYISAGWAWTGGAGAGSTAEFMVGLHRIGANQI